MSFHLNYLSEIWIIRDLILFRYISRRCRLNHVWRRLIYFGKDLRWNSETGYWCVLMLQLYRRFISADASNLIYLIQTRWHTLPNLIHSAKVHSAGCQVFSLFLFNQSVLHSFSCVNVHGQAVGLLRIIKKQRIWESRILKTRQMPSYFLFRI